jgi:ATP-dependent DNA helicase RecG
MILPGTASELIKRLNEIDESEDLEAKTAGGNDSGKSLYETVCAMANEPGLGGGVILLGVAREVGLFSFYTATGVLDPDKLSSEIVSKCGSLFNSPIRVNVTPEKVGRKVVLKITVPESPKAQKPVYFKATGLPKGAFRRLGPTDVRCTDEDLSAFFMDQSHETADSQVVKEASWNDIDRNAIQAYRRSRKEAYPAAAELEMSDEDMLEALGAVRIRDGKIRCTLAGILLFGTQAALRRHFPSTRFDYIRVPSLGWAENIDMPFEALEMRGSLLLVAQKIMAAIADDLPKAFKIEEHQSGQRVEMPVLPFRVIREAVVNALMHRNYRANKPVQILRYPNRLVIKNPGYSLKAEERFDESGSALRNPIVAEVLHETRYAETKGSGIRVMKRVMEKSGLASPTFESDRTLDEFTATFLFHHFLDEKDIAWLANFKLLDLSQDQMKGMIFLREVGAISNSIYRGLNSVDTLTASKSLRKLRTLELIVEPLVGSKNTYVPGPEFAKLANKDGSTQTSAVTMDAKSHLDAEGNSFLQILMAEMPDKLRKEVLHSQLQARLQPEKALDLIVRLCQWRALSLTEIAKLLDKSSAHVSAKYIQSLISEGRIQYTFPEMIQHPHQRYKAK